MRLIDADKLKEFLNGVKKESRDCTTKEFLEITEGIIDKQPATFDMDKVIEQLEELKEEDVCTNISCVSCKYNAECNPSCYADQKSYG